MRIQRKGTVLRFDRSERYFQKQNSPPFLEVQDNKGYDVKGFSRKMEPTTEHQPTPLLLPSSHPTHSTKKSSSSSPDPSTVDTTTTTTDTNSVTSSSSDGSYYVDHSKNDLSLWTGAALLTADTVGTGVLALPHNVKLLGAVLGFGFILLNFPLNLYAGTILSSAAESVEHMEDDDGEEDDGEEGGGGRYEQLTLMEEDDEREEGGDDEGYMYARLEEADAEEGGGGGGLMDHRQKKEERRRSSSRRMVDTTSLVSFAQSSKRCQQTQKHHHHQDNPQSAPASSANTTTTTHFSRRRSVWTSFRRRAASSNSSAYQDATLCPNEPNPDTATFDFIGMSSYLFISPLAIKFVVTLFYTNLFLVMGNYVLIMGHAVRALVGENNICLPTAGLLASTLMYALVQIRTMARLGRHASVISLTAVAIVVIQCLVSVERGDEAYQTAKAQYQDEANNEWYHAMRQLAALSSIVFAINTQSLLLNIRHEMQDRKQAAPGSLGISLGVFMTFYVLVCLLAGPAPPPFLFDAIGEGPNRRIAGFLLWVHLTVSFAINSQALCSSMDRLVFYRVTTFNLNEHHRFRWALLTLLVSVVTYTVSNAVPFIKDLVALTGALTSVPLSFMMPAILYRKSKQFPLCSTARRLGVTSFGLLLFSVLFLVVGLIGAIWSIEVDWSHNKPFACQ